MKDFLISSLLLNALSNLSPTIERINTTDSLIVNSWKGVPLYRIRLTVKSQALKGKIEYKIK